MEKITAKDITHLLAVKHSKDVFVPECKDGPSMFGEHLRMDAWVMPRSWTKPWTTGYEIKVSRSDFLKDEKWHGYLDYCNFFYFVCPWGLIQPEEVPEGVGLMWATKTATRLHTKRKAIKRDVEIPESLFRYILMSRAKIDAEYREGIYSNKKEYWERWLKDRKLDMDFGHKVSRKIWQVVREQVNAVQCDNGILKEVNAGLQEVKTFLEDIGIDTSRGWQLSPAHVQRRLQELELAVPKEVLSQLERTIDSLQRSHQKLIDITNKGAA